MLINLRNAMMTGKRLPYDAEVEYLESTGTQWIDTGLTSLAVDTIFEATFAMRNIPSGNSFFGADSILTGAQSGKIALTQVVMNANAFYTTKLVYAVGSNRLVYVNGELAATASKYHAVYPIKLFALGARSDDGSIGSFLISHVEIWMGGTLVRDYIPVRKSTVGYLYDRVSKRLFGNAGTGDFVLGPDVVPVEYIESHGTEYINLDYLQASKLRVKFEASIASSYTGGEMDLLSNQYTAQLVGRFAIGVYQSRFFAYSRYEDNDGNATSDIVSPDTMYSVDCTFDTLHDTKTLSVDGIDFTANKCTNISNRGNRVRLFSAANIVTSTWKGRIKFLKMWKDDVPWYNHIPVRVGTDATSWEGATMDVLTRRIYRNAGTGAFTFGNDLKYPIPAA